MSINRSDVIDRIARAGVVGCGGAGFPTHVKLRGPVEIFLINGAECEPLLFTDRYIMRSEASKIIEAIEVVQEAVSARESVIVLKKSYGPEIAALTEAIASRGASIRIHSLDSFYPAGDEQIVVYEATGRVVPPGGIPLDVQTAVSNVATMLAIYEALRDKPVTHRILTVAGAVHTPLVLEVPIGTSLRECLELAGGAVPEDYLVLTGGPMMGMPVELEKLESTSVTKTTSGILVVPNTGYLAAQNKIPLAHMINRASSACIQCSYCTQLCPRYLLGHPLEPHRIMRTLALHPNLGEILDDPVIRHAALCCECGVCESYACPMELQPRRVNVLIKQALREKGIKLEPAAEAAVPLKDRAFRKIPTTRVAARVGVSAYLIGSMPPFMRHTPGQISVPLKQHIGVPAEPVVHAGQTVREGQLIARCPEGALGANIHAGIGGTVLSVSHEIVIRGEGGH